MIKTTLRRLPSNLIQAWLGRIYLDFTRKPSHSPPRSPIFWVIILIGARLSAGAVLSLQTQLWCIFFFPKRGITQGQTATVHRMIQISGLIMEDLKNVLHAVPNTLCPIWLLTPPDETIIYWTPLLRFHFKPKCQFLASSLSWHQQNYLINSHSKGKLPFSQQIQHLLWRTQKIWFSDT